MLQAPPARVGDAADSVRPATRPYLPVPVNLVVAYKHRPAVIGLYASIARLNVVKKDAVDVSRADLAHWCDSERDTLAGCIKRGIDDLDTAGWLLTERPTGGKMRLLAGWSLGAAKRPRPWRFDIPNRAHPKGMRCVTLPLDVLDLGLGRLRPNSDGPAEIDRYFNQALLSYQDIGIYVLSQLADTHATARLNAICQPTSAIGRPLDFPTLVTLLERAATETLTFTGNDATICVRLSPAGNAHYERLAQRQSGTLVAQRGSGSDHASPPDGSACGSPEISPCSPSPSPITRATTPENSTWDQDGINKLKKYTSSSHDSRVSRAETTRNDDAWQQSIYLSQLEETELYNVSVVEPPGNADSEENHISALDVRVLQWHRALNPDRTIACAEQFALLHVQEQYGVDALKRWQFNASSAGKTRILPSYYQQCAATHACDMLSHAEHRSPHPPHRANAHQVDKARVQPHATASACVPARLDTEHKALIAELAQITGCVIRRPEKLANTDVRLLARWRDSAHHPGLLARWQIGWVIKEISLGHEPPTRDELTRWAEEHGISTYDPRLAPFRQVQVADTVNTDNAMHKDADATHVDIPIHPDLYPQMPHAASSSVSTHTEFWPDVCQALVQRVDRSAHVVLRSLYVYEMDDTSVTLGIPHAAHKTIIENTYLPLIRDVLSEHLGRTVRIRIVIASPSTRSESLNAAQMLPSAMMRPKN